MIYIESGAHIVQNFAPIIGAHHLKKAFLS